MKPLGTGTGNGQASDAGQCVLVTGNTITAGQMYMTLTVGNATTYASRLTNKYIWDGSTPPNRYAVNFFSPEYPGTIANVAITSNAGAFLSNAYSTLNVGDLVTVAGNLTGSGSIVGYANTATNYYVINTNGSTTFTLSASLGGANVVTTVGNTRGLTFAVDGGTTVVAKSGAQPQTWSNGKGNITLAQVSSYTS
jgi:hypothetical protein